MEAKPSARRKTAKPAPRGAARGKGASASLREAMTPAKMAALVREGKVPPHYAVAKSDGDSAVRAWVDLLPEWQSALARRIDAVVTRALPGAHKAVKWHGAWYGVPGKGWFLAMASFRAHLKLVFFDGESLTPAPPVPLAARPQRALDLREADALDEARLARWVKQAGRLPGWGRA